MADWNPSVIPLVSTPRNPSPGNTPNGVIYLVVDDKLPAKELCAELEHHGYGTQCFSNLHDFESACEQALPTVVVMDMVFVEGDTAGAQVIAHLKEKHRPAPPVVFISGRGDAEVRLAAVRAGAARFFTKPIDSKKLKHTLDGLTAQIGPEPYRVLIIDDDESLADYHAAVLRDAGMIVRTLADPMQGLDVLSDFQPELVLMDVDMPDCSGPELAAMIRQDDVHAKMAIVFLSTKTALDRQLAVMNPGDDDFLIKPVEVGHLAMAVTARVKRARALNRLGEELQTTLQDIGAVFKNMQDIFYRTDKEGRITMISPSVTSHLQFTPDEILGRHLGDYYAGPEGRAKFLKKLEQSGGEISDYELPIVSKDGTHVWMSTNSHFYYDHGGVIAGVEGMVRNVTKKKYIEEELRLLATTFETHEAITIADKHGNILRVNRAFTEITGYASAEVIGKNPRILQSGRHGAEFYRTMWTQLNDNGHWEGEVWNRRKSGEVYPEWLSITAVTDSEGRTSHYVATFLDLSELRQQQQHIERTAAEEQALGILLRLSLEPLGMKEYLEQVLEVMMEAVPWLGLLPRTGVFLNAQEGQGNTLILTATHDLSPELHSLCAEVPFGKCMCGRAAAQRAIQFADCVDERHEISFEGMPPHGHYNVPILQGEEVLGVLVLYLPAGHERTEGEEGFLRRIADVLSMGISRRYAEQALRRAKQAADKANQAKSDFLSSMSHELRTPMNAILGFGQLLGIESLTTEQTQYVQEIAKAGHHLLGLINEVLDLAKIESGRIDLSLEVVESGEVFLECLNLIAPLAQQRNIAITFHSEDAEVDLDDIQDQRLRLRADRMRLRQVLLNLLSNAVKYNHEGGKIDVRCGQVGADRVRVSITDTGPGIAPERQAQLFQPFNRLGAEQTDIEGTGIGLVIAKNIVELMDGTMGVYSEPGKGSTFWFELPGEGEPQDEGPQAGVEEAVEDTALTVKFEHTLLYVEDNPANLRLVEQLLLRRPHIHLLTAGTAEQGLEMVATHKPDLILLDINLPDMDGYEVLKHLRAGRETNGTPVIAISANAMPEDIDKGKVAGFTNYLLKPLDVPRFLSVIDRVLAGLEYE